MCSEIFCCLVLIPVFIFLKVDTCVYCCLVLVIGIKDQNLALFAEEVSKEFAPETFGCLQITVISLTLQI
jgi:hypothetical protein